MVRGPGIGRGRSWIAPQADPGLVDRGAGCTSKDLYRGADLWQQRDRLGLTAQEVDEVFLTGERLLAPATFPERALKTTNAARHETSRTSEHGGLVVAFTFDEDHLYLVGIDRAVADGALERSADSTGRCDDGNQR